MQPTQAIGRAPKHLNVEERRAYDELVAAAHDGVLSAADGIAVELAAVLVARMRADPKRFTAGEFGRLQALLGSLGMTPSDRSKVTVARKPKPRRDSVYAEFEPAR